MYRHLLVPIDGGVLSAEVVSRAVTFAKALGARVTFFHAAADDSVSLRGDAALLHAMAPERFAVAFAERSHAVLAKAAAAAGAQGVPCDTVSTITDAVAEAILDAAVRHDCDLIVLSTSGRPGKLPMMLGSVALDVLARSAIPVLVNNFRAAPNPAARVLGIIRDEHESLAVVVQGLDHHLRQAAEKGVSPDIALLRAMFRYLREFPRTLHHPKEEEHLFPALRRRTSAFNDTIDELQRQHVEEARLLDVAEAALDAFARDPAAGAGTLRDAASALGRQALAHIALEETVILPAAGRCLDDGDWDAIDDAFSGNGDPHFAAGCDEDHQALFARLISLFPFPPTPAQATAKDP